MTNKQQRAHDAPQQYQHKVSENALNRQVFEAEKADDAHPKKIPYINFPISILEGVFENHKDVFNRMCFWALADKMRGYAGGYDLTKLVQAKIELQLNNVETDIGVYGRCMNLHKKYGGARAGLSLENVKYLHGCWGYLKDIDKVLWLMFIASKSIIGDKVYCKTNDLQLFARMNGRNNSYAGVEDLLAHSHPVIAGFYTRRKRATLKKRLAEQYNINCYSSHNRGYYISRKLSYDKLKELVERDRLKKKLNQGVDTKKMRTQLYRDKKPDGGH